MEFESFPKSGFVGTQFGYKVTGFTEGERYRFEFGKDGGSTDWIDGKTFVYQSFKSHGTKVVRMETDSGDIVEREVLVRDARQFGTGKVESAEFVPGTKYLVLKLSNGIETYHLDDLQGLFLEIDYDEIYPVDHRRVFVTWKEGKRVGILDLETGRFSEEKEGDLIHVFPDEHLVLVVANGRIEVLDYLGWEVRGSVEGDHVTTSTDYRTVLYRYDHLYHLYQIDSQQSVEVGPFDSMTHVSRFDDYIGLKKDGNDYIFWTDSRETWDLSLLNDEGEIRSELGDLIDIPGEGTCIRVRRELPYGRLFLRLLPLGEGRVIERFWVSHVVVQDSSPDLLRKFFAGQPDSDTTFVGFLYGEVYYQRKYREEYEIVETSTEEVVLRSPDRVRFVFEYDGRRVAVVNTDETTTLIDLDAGSIVVEHEGEFEEKWVPLLRERGQLWVKHSLPRNRYTVYDGVSDRQGIVLDVDSTEGEFVVSRDGIRSIRDLSDVRTFDGKLMGISEEGTHVVVEKEGQVVLYRDHSSNEPTTHDLRVMDGTHTNVGFSPDGKFLALGKKGTTEVVDLDTFETVKVLDGEFVRYDPDGRIRCAEHTDFNRATGVTQYWGRPRIFDPVTFEQVDSGRFDEYVFLSKDGRVGTTLVPINKGGVRYFPVYHFESGRVICTVGVPMEYSDHSNFKFTNFVALHTIPNVLTVSVAGKMHGPGGRVRVVRAEFRDGLMESVDLPAGLAVWKCQISGDGKHLAYYDSNPRTYVYSLEDLWDQESSATPVTEAVPRKVIPNRSLESFSPNSTYLLLSDRRYRAMSIGGEGWVPSRTLWITSLDGEDVASFGEHSTDIVFANFDRDGRRVVSRDEGGIVILRELEEGVRQSMGLLPPVTLRISSDWDEGVRHGTDSNEPASPSQGESSDR